MDQALANSYIGKHLLVGVTYLDHNEQLLKKEQFHGCIVRINELVIRLHDSEHEFRLPPQLESLKAAAAGEYRLRATGEVVVNPDLVATWTVVSPKPE